MSAAPIDPVSTAGATLAVAETVDLLVVGAGRAGIAAALQGRRNGESVVLVDENPVPAETMGDDIPHLFGAAMSGAARNRTAMTEALLDSRPGLAEAFEAGVDVRLGTACWGLYANNAAVTWLPGPVAGLSDGENAAMLGFRRAVVATGCRDMGVAFPGWDLPGVSGVLAARNLVALGAYARRRAVLLGTGEHAVAAARALGDAGVEIAAVVEVAAAPLSDAAAALGAPVLCGHRAVRAEGGLDGVEALVVSGPEGERRIPCDAVLLGVAAVPVIELLDALGCRTAFHAGTGGRLPVLDADGRTSVAAVSAAGSCAHPPAAGNGAAYRMAWVEALVVDGGGDAPGDVHVCRCEEVTARDILEVRPPRYLGSTPRPRPGLHNNTSLHALLGEGPPNPDQVKRLTRAGMGLCQGRRCREQVACLLALGSGGDLSRIPPATYRAPVRPLPLRLAHAVEEPAEMRRHWDTWFGMFSQYVPFWEAKGQYTAAGRPLDAEVASE